MPNLIKVDYDALHKEIDFWYTNHRGMKPFIIMSTKTLKLIEADCRTLVNFINAKTINVQSYAADGSCLLLMGCDVAICETLAFGEFKVR